MLYKKEIIENNKILKEENRKLNKEIERLNNIINKLETKLLNVCSTYISNDEVLKMAKYIRELKGSDKE